MNNDIQCPLCESTDIETRVINKKFFEPFGGSSEASINKHHCENCGLSGDFLKTNDDIIQSVLDQLKERSAISILSDFAKHGYNFSSLERALELPQRTLTKWKTTGKTSAAGLTLLRFLRLFPWLIEVAEKRFDYQEAQRTCINAAMKTVRFQDPLSTSGMPAASIDTVYFQQNNYYGNEAPLSIVIEPNNEGNPTYLD